MTSERLLERVNFHHAVALCQSCGCKKKKEADWWLAAAAAKLQSHRQRGGSILIWRREVTACSVTDTERHREERHKL